MSRAGNNAKMPPPTDARYTPITRTNVSKIKQWNELSEDDRQAILVVSTVLPFRTNRYITDSLIDWSRVPNDPMYQLTFPQRGMLSEEHYQTIHRLLENQAATDEIERAANQIRFELNPHPAGQMTHNVPMHHGEPLPGVQHKYRETVLFFPSHGQTCHAYCTFCFRWAQFVGMSGLKFANREIEQLAGYLRDHEEVTDVLITGGDPMIMAARNLRGYIEPLLEIEHVQTIRIGTKSVAYWPQRFVSDADADDVLRLFEQVVRAGKHLAIMGHYSHPVELSTDVSQEAVRRIRSAGANIRMQSPIIRYVNDDPEAWAQLWRQGANLGCIPYYMFVERDTGARSYFELPLVRCWNIFRAAYQNVSGVARTVRGPSMSAFPGKVHLLGVTEVAGKIAFVLEYLQCRRPELVRRPFFARFDPRASWYDHLVPLSASDRQFFLTPDDFPPATKTTPLRVQGSPLSTNYA